MMSDNTLTTVIIAYRKNRFNHRLIFGEPALKIRRGWRREFAAFTPGRIFGYERWRANKYGTQDWRLFVCEAVNGGAITRLPGIHPGARLLASASGKSRVTRLFTAFDDLKNAYGALDLTPPERWRVVANEIETSFRKGHL